MSDPEPEDEIDNAASPEAVRRKTQRARKAEDEGAEFWKAALADKTGRRELWGLLQRCGTFESRFACSPNGTSQAEATWFQAGQKEVGQALFFSLQRIDFQGTHLMLLEHDPRFAKPKRK